MHMKHIQTVTSLIAAGALMATPLMALAKNGSDDLLRLNGEDRVLVDQNLRIRLENFFDAHRKGSDHAQTSATTTTRVKGDASIEARLEKLSKLEERIANLTRLPDEQKASLTNVINAQIVSLMALKARLASTTDDDQRSLAKSNRVAALVMPQVAITAASNRALTIVAQMEALAPKLETRIASSSALGIEVAAAEAAHADMLAKIADAKVQAQAAANATVNLEADNGDQAVFKANQQALKDARAKLKAAEADLRAARKDIMTIFQVLKVKGDAHASTTSGVLR